MESSTQGTPVSAPPAVAARGYHAIIDISGVPAEVCEDDAGILALLVDAARRAGVNVINSCRYHFGHNSPPGCTCFVLLDESHISAHTYADVGLVAVDIFCCGESAREKVGIVLDCLRRWQPQATLRETHLTRFQLEG